MFSFILVIAIYDPDFARQPKVAGPALAFLAQSVSFEGDHDGSLTPQQR